MSERGCVWPEIKTSLGTLCGGNLRPIRTCCLVLRPLMELPSPSLLQHV